MKKRIIAFLLCIALVMPILPTFASATEDITLSATSVTLPQYEKKTITASPVGNVQVSSYQWQINVPGTDLWVDISGAEGATLELSYAMIASLLQGDQAQIRCEAVIGGETVETDVVTVTMDYTSEPAVQTESEPAKPQVLTEATVVESSVSAPAEEEEKIESETVDLAALEEARNAAIVAETDAETAVAAAQEKLTAAQTAEEAAKAALDQAQADYDAAVAAAATAETEEPNPTGESTEGEDSNGDITESTPVVTVDTTALDAAKAAYAAAQAVTAAAQKELDEANAALTAAQAKTAAAREAYEAAEAKAAAPARSAFNVIRRTSNAVMMANEEVEVPDSIDIVINYVFDKDGSTAENPYTATVISGSDFYVKRTNPEIQGYKAHVKDADGNYVESTEVEIDLKNVTENKTYYVYYKPTSVKYTVTYMFENAEGTDYEVGTGAYEPKEFTGLTEDLVDENKFLLNSDVPGFEMLYYDTPRIAADGSTNVKVYYDRLFVLMLFELNGGYGVDPIYARYGAPVTVGTPTRMGYTFTSWSPAVPSTVPEVNTTYEASWNAGSATYTVMYWAENANDNDYSFWGSATKSAAAGNQVSGSDDFAGTNAMPKTGFHFDHADTDVVVKGDGSSIVNVYYKRNTWTLIFAYSNGEMICSGTHSHNSECLSCTKDEHEHNYSCAWGWGCELEEHEHSENNGCYGCGQVAHQSHSVANGCYGMKFENVKYGQATDQYWEQAPSMKWLVSPNSSTFYTNAPAMPNSNLIIYGTSQSGRSTIHYYEKVNGQETTNKVHPDYVVNTDEWSFTEEDYIVIPGFTYNSSRKNYSGTQYYIYYTRNSYSLSFKNGSVVTNKGNFLYEADISGQNWTPTYNGDEADAYTFGGWYTTEDCLDGTEFNFTGAKMPYNNLILYAKWVPVNRYVNVYLDESAMAENNKLVDTIVVQHGSFVPEEKIPERPNNGALEFVGWFYKDGDVEKAFDFKNMPVNKDLNIYGKWDDTTPVTYTINYIGVDEDGTKNVIANQETGRAMSGSSITFDAKSGNQLYVNYREGWFPETNSHMMEFSATHEEQNTYYFIYHPADNVPYKVRYLIQNEDGTTTPAIKNADGSEYIKTVNPNRKAVVTEIFEVVPGYMPDAYQKQLVVSLQGPNEIIFYYHVDTENAYYGLSHWIEPLTENPAKEDYTQYGDTLPRQDEINSIVNAEPTNIPGFTYVSSMTEYVVGDKDPVIAESAILTAESLEFKHYYKRNLYDYTVKYLEKETNEPVATEKVVENVRFGETVKEDAINVPGYEVIAPDSQEMIIKTGTNEIIFYYQEKEAKIIYEVVGPTGSGTVDLNEVNDTAAATVFEEFKAASGAMVTPKIENKNGPVGATAKATSNVYKFEGWYLDADCTQPVNAEWVDENNSIVPVKPEAGWPDATTYYAKFVWNKTHMTLKKVVNGDVYDTGDSFIFKVSDAEGTVLTTVSLQDGGSVVIDGLTVGKSYTITEIGGGSNRYTADNNVKSITLVANPDNDENKNVVIFTNTLSNNKWLTATDVKHNVFG